MTAVEVETRNKVRWIYLNRPERLNAIDDDIREALIEEMAAANEDVDVRSIVISGRGRAFCSGGNVGGMSGRTPELTVSRMFRSATLLNAIVNCNKPVIAAVNGLAVGAGASLTLSCDLAFAAEDAWLAFVFVEMGLVPDFSSTYFLPRIVGSGRAKELMITGRRLDAASAQELGLLAGVFESEHFEESVQQAAEALDKPGRTVIPLIRRLVNHSFETDFRSALEREALAQGVATTMDGHHEAVEAFKAKRGSK